VRWFARERVLILFWLAASATVLIMAVRVPAGWDAGIYEKAIQSVRHGVDPYAAGLAEQRDYINRPASRQAEHAPFTYVYSPLTVPVLRLLSWLPDGLLRALFWAALAMGFFLQLWAGWQFADERERSWLILLLPAVAFFPGLITDDVILSGNVSYLLYGLVLAAAVPGWKRGRWFWFYAAVLAASFFKVQLLTLLALPVLMGKRQWLPACGSAAVALSAMATQALLWPQLFREYLATIRVMFDLIPDFGYGPAGILGRFLWNHGQPYASETSIMYLAFAGTLGLILLFFSYQVREDVFSRDLWLPVALVGTFLLNPRIMKYDMAALTIPMLLIASRGLRAVLQSDGDSAVSSSRVLVLVGAGCFLVPNLMTIFGPVRWPVELLVLLTVFALGARSLWQPEVRPRSLATAAELIVAPAELIELAIPEEMV
jgi:glycosyl transferase family 87